MVATYAVKGDSFVPEKPRVWSEKRFLRLKLEIVSHFPHVTYVI